MTDGNDTDSNSTVTDSSEGATANGSPDEGPVTPERAVDPVLLNALAAVVVEEETLTVLRDKTSAQVVQETFEAVTTPTGRDQFRAAVEAVQATGEAGEDAREAVEAVVDDVRNALADRGARVVVDHRATVTVDPHTAAVYDFVRTRDPETLSALDLQAPVDEHVERGASHTAAGDLDAAANAFTRAVDAAGTGDGAVTTRALAAWAHHWAGDDHGAIDFVEEALHLHDDAWAPSLAGYSADPDRSFARPEQFRDGKYAAMAVLRYTIDTPEGTAVTPFVGIRETANGPVEEWVELTGTDECTPITRLGPDPVLRLQLAGEVPAFPAVYGYYVGLGVVDREVKELRAVYRLLVEGPASDRVTETVAVETSD